MSTNDISAGEFLGICALCLDIICVHGLSHDMYSYFRTYVHCVQRVMGFAICFTAGYLMSFASLKLIFKLVEGNPAPFVFLYTSGNLLSLLSSTFLSGPKRQFKYMFDEKRSTTSIIYLSTLGTSIVVCFVPFPALPKMGVLVLLLLVQMCASLWYTLSYVPYGRATAKRMLKSLFSGEE